jgi:YHS domain-containing protein
MRKTAASNQIFIDPVCRMKVDSGDKSLMFTHKLRTYYFCAESCRKAFIEDPEKYLDPKLTQRKGWWDRYLERLNKTTGDKTTTCCH